MLVLDHSRAWSRRVISLLLALALSLLVLLAKPRPASADTPLGVTATTTKAGRPAATTPLAGVGVVGIDPSDWVLVVLQTYTDYAGNAANQKKLGLARAAAVCTALRAYAPQVSSRTVISYRGTRPACSRLLQAGLLVSGLRP